MRKRCPNQHRWRFCRRDGAVGCLMRSRMLRLLMCCCQNTRRRHLWQHMLNTYKRRRSARVVNHASEPLSKTETIRARYMLILILMLMRCVRNSGFDRRYMAEAALAMRYLMSRDEEPSFVIRYQIYVKESTNSTSMWHMFNADDWWGWVRGDIHEFGLRPADLELMVTIYYQ